MRLGDRIFLATISAAAVNLLAMPLESSIVGALFFLPGQVLEGIMGLGLTLLLSANGDYFQLPHWSYLALNLAFYALIFWLASFLWRPSTRLNPDSASGTKNKWT